MDRCYSQKAVNEATELLKELLVRGRVSLEAPLAVSFVMSEEVRTLLHGHMLPIWEAAVSEGGGCLHLFPAPTNRDITPTADELRDRLGIRGQSAVELNLAFFIMIAAITLLQGDAGAGRRMRMYIRRHDIVQYVSDRLSQLRDMEQIAHIEATSALDVRAMADVWFSMQEIDHRDVRRTQGHQEGRVHKMLQFWQAEGLVHVDDEGRVFPEERLQAAFEVFRDRGRKDLLLRLLQGSLENSHPIGSSEALHEVAATRQEDDQEPGD